MSFNLGSGLLVGQGGGAGSGVTLSAHEPVPELFVGPINAFGMGRNVSIVLGGFGIGRDITVRNGMLLGGGSVIGGFASGGDVMAVGVGLGLDVAGTSSAVLGVNVRSLGMSRTVEVGVWNNPDQPIRFRECGSRYVGGNGQGSAGITSHCLTLSDTPVLPWSGTGSEQMRLQSGMWTICATQNGNLRLDYNFEGTVNSIFFGQSAFSELLHPFVTTNRDSGRTLIYDGSGNISLSLSDLSGPTRLVQLGTGKITLIAGNQTVHNVDGRTRTRGQYSVVEIIGRPGMAVITGDLETV